MSTAEVNTAEVNTAETSLLYSEVETDLRASVHDLLADRFPAERLLERAESTEPYDLDVWRTLAAEMGMAGLRVPEERGGSGGSARETAVVLEELGHNVAPVPFLGSTLLAESALLGVTEPSEHATRLLRELASGQRTGCLAVPLSTAPGGEFTATVTSDGARLHGEVRTVADASAADVLLVPASGEDGPGLYTLDAHEPGVSVAEVVSLDITRRVSDVSLAGASARPLARGDQARSAVEYALRASAALLASEQLGLAQWCLDETVRYVSRRHQFGRPVGSFQALKHRLADLYLELVSARAAARNAADAVASDSADLPVAAAVAQSYCANVAVHAAEECVQLHGGIGMTWEHPAHLYLKRAKSDQIALGTPGEHRAVLAGLVDLPA